MLCGLRALGWIRWPSTPWTKVSQGRLCTGLGSAAAHPTLWHGTSVITMVGQPLPQKRPS